MSDDLDQDVIPVKEIPEISKKTFEIKDDVQHRRMVFKLSRDDLEDRFLRLCEEHLLLKRHACKQEDKIKKMATKLVRLINDHKNQEHGGGGGGGKRRNIETEDLIEEMQSKIRELDRQNTLLKEKLVATKQQLAAHTKHIKLFTHSHCQAHSRPNTGISRTSGARYGYSEGGYSPPVPDYREGSFQDDAYRDPSHLRNRPSDEAVNRSILREDASIKQLARKNSQSPAQQWDGMPPESNLDDIITALKEQVDILEQENALLKKNIQENQQKHDEVVVALKSQVNQNQKQTVYENIEIIKLQRETKQAQDKMASLLDQYNKLQENYLTMKGSQERLLREIENLNFQLKEEQHHSVILQREMKESSLNSMIITELREQTSMLQKEISILKDSNLKLISSAISMEKDRQHHDMEMSLKLQVMKLEETIKSQKEEKNESQHKLAMKTEEHNELEKNLKTTQSLFSNLKEEYEKFKIKMAVFAELQEDASINISDIKEAITFLKTKQDHPVVIIAPPPPEPEEPKIDVKKQISQLEMDHAETAAELKKAQTMLQVQYKISNEYKNEIELLNQQIYQLREEIKTRIQEKDHLLEIRGSHIQRLEEQLKDIAYGTKPVKIDKSLLEEKDENISKSLDSSLSGGENTFEIHIKKVILTAEGEKMLENENPATFLTWNFYDFELMSTPVVQGKNPVFQCSSQYNVTVDMLFLHYLNKEPMTLEYHEVIEMEYFTIATAQVRLRELLDLSGGRLHASIPLISETNVVGNVEYWVSLKLPLTTSIKYYREKSKALSYLKANENITVEALALLENQLSSESKKDFNVLSIKIIKCLGLKVNNKNLQPSSYCMYKFYNWPDHDTIVIPSSNDPLFNDHKVYRLSMDENLEEYLQTQTMEFYVFDDDDPDETEFLGHTSIPLQPLVNNTPIKGSFQLTQSDGSPNGTIEVEIKWHFPYSGSTVYKPKQISENKSRMTAGKETFVNGEQSPKSEKTFNNQTLQAPLDDNADLSNFASPLLTSTPSQSNVTNKPPVAPRHKSLQGKNSDSLQQPVNDELIEYASLAFNTTANEDEGTNSESEDKEDELLENEITTQESEQLDSSSDDVSMNEKNSYKITIEIGCLILYEDSHVLNNDHIQILYVEYEFLNYPLEELEAPAQMKSKQPIVFNFKKEFDFNPEENFKTYQMLKQALTSDETRITFTIVSEPLDQEQNMEYKDIGFAYFDLKEVIDARKNFIDHELHVYDSSDQTTVIGSLIVTVQALQTLIRILS